MSAQVPPVPGLLGFAFRKVVSQVLAQAQPRPRSRIRPPPPSALGEGPAPPVGTQPAPHSLSSPLSPLLSPQTSHRLHSLGSGEKFQPGREAGGPSAPAGSRSGSHAPRASLVLCPCSSRGRHAVPLPHGRATLLGMAAPAFPSGLSPRATPGRGPAWAALGVPACRLPLLVSAVGAAGTSS